MGTIDLFPQNEGINFGDLLREVDALLQQGVTAYWRDPERADGLFREALAAAPAQLPIYFCPYKSHTYRGRLDDALEAAEGGLREAAAQAGWSLIGGDGDRKPRCRTAPAASRAKR